MSYKVARRLPTKKLALLLLGQITLKEEVEKGSNHGDNTKSTDFLPRWSDTQAAENFSNQAPKSWRLL